MNVEERLLQLADSLAEEMSAVNEDRFKGRVYAALGIARPGEGPKDAEGVGRGDAAGPSGGDLREGDGPALAGRCKAEMRRLG